LNCFGKNWQTPVSAKTTESLVATPLTKVKCCYDHRAFTATVVAGCHRTTTANAVLYSILGGLFGAVS